MSMFDYIKLKNPIKCPSCKHSLKDFQTKDLENLMDVYIEGKNKSKYYKLREMTTLETQEYKEKHGGLTPWNPFVSDKRQPYYQHYPKCKFIYVYDYCRHCDKMIGMKMRFSNYGKLYRYSKPEVEK
jgi:phosphoribulokinase